MKRLMILCVMIISIFFSGSCFSSHRSIEMIESRSASCASFDITDECKRLRELQFSMDGLWIEMMGANDDVGYKAYIAFLDAADGNFPIVDYETMKKLSHYDLAFQLDEDSEIWFDSIKLNLWDKHGVLGDNMKPTVKGAQ